MKRKLGSLLLCVILCLSINATVFATDCSDTSEVLSTSVYIDASEISQNDLDTRVREASDDNKTIVIDWGTAIATLHPITEPEITTFIIDDTKDLALTTDYWTYFAEDYGLTKNTMRVTNKTGNPGPINIRIKYPDHLVHTYYYELDEGYYTDMTVVLIRDMQLWVAASSVDGDYKITAKRL